jgi:hypothetical protein
MPVDLPRVTLTSPVLTSASERFMEVFGSETNYEAMVLLDRTTNVIKGSLFGFKPPFTSINFARAVENSVYDGADTTRWLTFLQKVSPAALICSRLCANRKLGCCCIQVSQR